MIKNMKMRTALTSVITIIAVLCIAALYISTQNGMTRLMKKQAQSNMESELNSQTILIEEYVNHQEDLLEEFSTSPIIVDYLKDVNNVENQKRAQEYTEIYYAGLNNWEGIYVGEWNTHVVTHSNKEYVGMTTREGDPLKQLQDAMTNAGGLYNAGIIVSPATKKLTLSMYCPVYDSDKKILGYVGGGPFAEELEALLAEMKGTDKTYMKYTMIHVASGMVIFDEDESVITTQTEDPGILQVIKDIQGGKDVDAFTSKGKKGSNDVIAYQYNKAHDWAVISRTKESQLYSSVYRMMRQLGVICIICCILIALSSWIFIWISTKPLDYVTHALHELKELKIHTDPRLRKYVGGESEVGQIATALNSLEFSLKDIVVKLGRCSKSLTKSARQMSDCSDVLLQCVGENAHVTEHFAEHTEEINQTVEQVDNGISDIAEVVTRVESKIQIGNARSGELMQKVSQMRELAADSLQNTNERMEQNQLAIENAIVKLKSLSKIDEMANQILDITNQTNMLSLNASIEAARAGETGRGFAVVAGEIGSLADNSHQTAVAIQDICEDTRNNIGMVRECFDNILKFLEEDVKTQFTGFVDATNEYNTSIAQIQQIIMEMSECSDIFAKSVADIQSQIDNVQGQPGDTQVHRDTVMEKVEQTRRTTQELADIAQVNEDNAVAIREILALFSD